jgi:hypothetical protein
MPPLVRRAFSSCNSRFAIGICHPYVLFGGSEWPEDIGKLAGSSFVRRPAPRRMRYVVEPDYFCVRATCGHEAKATSTCGPQRRCAGPLIPAGTGRERDVWRGSIRTNVAASGHCRPQARGARSLPGGILRSRWMAGPYSCRIFDLKSYWFINVPTKPPSVEPAFQLPRILPTQKTFAACASESLSTAGRQELTHSGYVGSVE